VFKAGGRKQTVAITKPKGVEECRLTSLLWLALVLAVSLPLPAQSSAQQAAPARARAVGTVKSIDGNTVTLTTDSGAVQIVTLQPETRLMRTLPGQTDLKTASPAKVTDIQIGDRLLAGGKRSDDGKSLLAATAIVMKRADISEKQQHDREEWQKHGAGGVVKSVDAGSGAIQISTGPATTLAVQVSKDTIIRRYAPDSIKFDDARVGTLDQVKPGDQLRARGEKSADGTSLKADEVVSGTFRNVAGTVVSTDPAKQAVTVMDLTSKKPVTLQVTAESQMHSLPPMVAQRIAARLKGAGAGGAAEHAGPASVTNPKPGEASPNGNTGASRAVGGGTPDFQQMLQRMPAVTLADLHKGDALMIVATEGGADSPSTAIILLSGVEPILTASPSQAGAILSPWNLGGGGAGAGGDTP
jgi:hypothetical protein